MRRIHKIVEIILSEILSPERVEITEKKIISILTQQGYRLDEINEALQFIFNTLKNNSQNSARISNRPIRVLSEFERFKISSDAQKILFKLYYSGAITLPQLEEILSRTDTINEVITEKIILNLIDEVVGLTEKNLYIKRYIN